MTWNMVNLLADKSISGLLIQPEGSVADRTSADDGDQVT